MYHTVNTYSQISSLKEVSLYTHQIVREDALLLYGFFSREERTLFRQLISVSGVGANTASVMLSSMTVKEIAGAILTENVAAIKSVKGIGLKTAQRVIIALKDKVVADGCGGDVELGQVGHRLGADGFGGLDVAFDDGPEYFLFSLGEIHAATSFFKGFSTLCS